MGNAEIVEVKAEEEAIKSIEWKKYHGATSYSVSGWAKWKDPAKLSPWHILFRLTVVD